MGLFGKKDASTHSTGSTSSPQASSGQAGSGNKETRKMHKITCSNCGKQAEVAFQPKEGKPVFCNDCFRRARAERAKQKTQHSKSPTLGEELRILNRKLDKIIQILTDLNLTHSTRLARSGQADPLRQEALEGQEPEKKTKTPAKKAAVEKTTRSTSSGQAKKTDTKKTTAKKSAAKKKTTKKK